MSVKLWETATSNNFSASLDGNILDSTTTITLSTTSGLQYPALLVIDRVDSNGTSSPLVREYISYTGVSGSNLTGVTRGVAGSTAQAHSSGAIVEEVFSITHWGDLVDFLQVSHDSAGKVITSSATITTLRATAVDITTSINASGASIVGWPAASGTGGFNASFQVPGGLASLANVGGLISVPVAFTAGFMQAYVQTPASVASVSATILKNNSVIGVVAILAGATFASSASFSSTALAVGDELRLNINSTASLAQNLSVLLRAT